MMRERRKRSERRPSLASKIREQFKRLFQRRGPEGPDDPYALVTAPKKPRPPHRSAAVAERLER